MKYLSSPHLYISPPYITGREQQVVQQVFDSNWIAPLGPQVDAFEAEFAAVVDACLASALNSGVL